VGGGGKGSEGGGLSPLAPALSVHLNTIVLVLYSNFAKVLARASTENFPGGKKEREAGGRGGGGGGGGGGGNGKKTEK